MGPFQRRRALGVQVARGHRRTRGVGTTGRPLGSLALSISHLVGSSRWSSGGRAGGQGAAWG